MVEEKILFVILDFYGLLKYIFKVLYNLYVRDYVLKLKRRIIVGCFGCWFDSLVFFINLKNIFRVFIMF